MSKRIMTFTDAPVAYDGFGTKTIRVLGKRRGKEVRIVETPEEHAQWQRDRYASGLYFAFDRRMWDEYKFSGELEGEPISGGYYVWIKPRDVNVRRVAERAGAKFFEGDIKVNIPPIEGASSKEEAGQIALNLFPGKVTFVERYK